MCPLTVVSIASVAADVTEGNVRNHTPGSAAREPKPRQHSGLCLERTEPHGGDLDVGAAVCDGSKNAQCAPYRQGCTRRGCASVCSPQVAFETSRSGSRWFPRDISGCLWSGFADTQPAPPWGGPMVVSSLGSGPAGARCSPGLSVGYKALVLQLILVPGFVCPGEGTWRPVTVNE